jgi:aminoglycoside 6'-N-acetyltransferase I
VFNWQIIDLRPADENATQQAAALLVAGFKEFWPDAWPDVATALQEVRESFGEGRLSRIAVDGNRSVLGWIGGISQYDGRVWELHPLVVREDCRGQGIGRALVTDLEIRVKANGGLTLWLGTDDEANMTSLGGVDLFPNVLDHLANIRNLRGHPYEFYQKLGFTVVGILPDANGLGKPDIFMAKSLVR